MRSRAVLGRRHNDVSCNYYVNPTTVRGIQPGFPQTTVVFSRNNSHESLSMEGTPKTPAGVGNYDSGLTVIETQARVGAKVYPAIHRAMGAESHWDKCAGNDPENNVINKLSNGNEMANGILSILGRHDLGNFDGKILTAQSPLAPCGRRIDPQYRGNMDTRHMFPSPLLSPSVPPHSDLSCEPLTNFNGKSWPQGTSGSTPGIAPAKTRKQTPKNKAANDNTAWLRCEICDCFVNSQYQMDIHNDGVKHRKKLSQLRRQMQPAGIQPDPYANADLLEPFSASPHRSGSTPYSPRSSQQVAAMISAHSPSTWVSSFPVDLRNDNFLWFSQNGLPGPGSDGGDSPYSGSDNDSTASM